MAKSKAPSPQEQYRARRAREERERLALLPPGLLNHGNTCFMNAVLQALIASSHLRLLVLIQPLPVLAHRSLRRSPALTIPVPDHDQPRSDTLPIAHNLVALLRIAWDIQDNRRRENISPKDILAALGKKYDQYLDFRQQDAHEFLCQLLDAIRMEEIDVFKQPSPPPPKPGKRSKQSRSRKPSPPDDEPLSFVDTLFGGKLASILVCQACKHVSHTYEDFTDLGLSMKPEDYVRERKRDKLKQFAKKIGTALYVSAPQQRSSSVPATPIRDSNLDSPEPLDSQRRRSIDLADVEMVVHPLPQSAANASTPLNVPPSPPTIPDSSLPETPIDTSQHVPVTDLSVPRDASGDHTAIPVPEKVNGKERRDKDKDESWTKISRRITVSVGLARKPKNERKDSKVTPSKPVDDGSPFHHVPSAPVSADTLNEATPSQPPLERESTSLGLVNEKLQAHLTTVKRSVMPTPRSNNSPSGSSAPRFPRISRPSSPGIHSKAPSKPPRPPKLSAEEAAYLRDILADINPPNIPKPFSIFKQSKEPSSSSLSSSFHSQNIFLKVNQINRIEECLRLFTSVEVLNGDNTVRCHRCWKIANGFYKPRARGSVQESDSCTDSEDDEAIDAKPLNGNHRSSTNSSPPHLPIPVTIPNPSYSPTSLQDTQISHDTQSTLTQISTRASSTNKHIPPALQLNDRYPIELVSPVKNETPTPRMLGIPTISTTPPQSPMPIQTAKPVLIRANTASTQASTTNPEYSSRLSLSAPSDQHRQHTSRNGDSNTESEISEGESETLLSVYSDISSVVSSNASPNASQEHLQQQQPSPMADAQRAKDKRHPSGVPRSRQFLLRPAYKRYLIATPPPILVVHLKRFQQLSKMPVVSFSTGFKKMDDYISFPEHLDLAPYLAPRREDYFDSKVAATRGRARRPAPCMYRLYAVVVHIGNMLGGHYVAYTALPPTPTSTPGSDHETSIAPSSGRSAGEQSEPKQQQRSGSTGSDTGTPSASALSSSSSSSSSSPSSSLREWAFVSDTVVRLSSLEEVLKSKAYICMYERI